MIKKPPKLWVAPPPHLGPTSCVFKSGKHTFGLLSLSHLLWKKRFSVDFLLCQMQVIAENFWKIFSVELFGP